MRPGGELPSREVAAVRVADLMHYGIVSVEPHDALTVAADLMAATRLHSLPVVERGTGAPARFHDRFIGSSGLHL